MMIVFENISFSYDQEKKVLDTLNLQLQPGLTMLIGPNGCGKSTLLRLAAGVEMPGSGRILIAGYDIWKEEAEARSYLVYLPEHPDLTPYATIQEVLDLVCRLRGEPRETAEKALQRAGIYDERHRTVRELSLGQRRRAVFAACLVGAPPVVLLDEPLEGMDLRIQKEIVAWIEDRIARKNVLLMASHIVTPFAELASHAVTLRNGGAEIIENLPGDPGRKLSVLKKLAGGEMS